MRILFYNGKIATLDKFDHVYQALGIEDNRIVFLGYDDAADHARYDQAIDLHGKFLMPGFNDSHLHLLSYGYTKKEIDLTHCTSINQAISEARDYIRKNRITKGEWVLGSGWNQAKLEENRFFTRTDLDQISSEHPIVFTRTCGHLLTCNSMAIGHIDQPGHLIEGFDLETGIFTENSMELVYDRITAPSLEAIKQYILDTCDELARSGITSVQTDDLAALPGRDYKLVLRAYEELEQTKMLKTRIYQQCSLTRSQLEDFVTKGYRTGAGTPFFKIGPLKMFQDGGLGARTALLNEDYSDDAGNSGTPLYSQQELDEFVGYAHRQGMQIAVHAIGDKAIEMVIGAFKKANKDFPRVDARHGVVHCHITNDAIVNQLAENQILTYIQPIFFNNDLRMLEQRVGSRASKSYLIRSLLDAGIRVSGGSDAPVEYFNPFHNIYCAMQRKSLQGEPACGFLPEERISIKEALKLFTIESAFCSFEEDAKGTLEVGKLADLILVDRDLYEATEDEIKEATVLMTLVDGVIVWRHPDF